ncbi:MAG: VWA-like domain-containing protein [Saprospiraceae bacterium]
MAPNILEQVSKTCIRMMLDDPFWGHLLSGILKKEVPHAPGFSWALTEDAVPLLQLNIQPAAWQALASAPERSIGVLKHELLHLYFRHPLQAPKYAYPELYNIACDLVVNQYLSPMQRPTNAILLTHFEALQLSPFQGVDYYYQALVKHWTEEVAAQKNMPFIALIQALKTDAEDLLQQHNSWWKTLYRLSQGERDIITTGLDQLFLRTLDRVGESAISHWPASLKLYLTQRQALRRSSKDWRRILRLFVNNSRKTRLKNTIRRPSKRYGTTPGFRIQRQQKLLVALDTSGSITTENYFAFFQEIIHLWQMGIEILVVECDTTIQQKYFFKGHIPRFVNGRGGSNFDPPIQLANEEYHPDAILYFTDGLAPPLTLKSRYPILWVLPEKREANWQQVQGRVIGN